MTVYIGFQGGTHGNFLRYFLDKFCIHTPKITKLPFTQNGTAHALKEKEYSGKFVRYHPSNEGWRNINEPHIIITIAKDDILNLQRLVYQRPGDEEQTIEGDIIKLKPHIDDYNAIEKLYGVEAKNGIPRFILRDFCKLGFSDIAKHGYLEVDRQLRQKLLPNAFYFPVRSFWETNAFIEQINLLDKKFRLDLHIDDDAIDIHRQFISLIPQLQTQDRAKRIIQKIKSNENIEISDIDVIEEAYIYSWIETTHRNILAPFTNKFFSSTGEILEYIKWYPHFYHGVNPTLPK